MPKWRDCVRLALVLTGLWLLVQPAGAGLVGTAWAQEATRVIDGAGDGKSAIILVLPEDMDPAERDRIIDEVLHGEAAGAAAEDEAQSKSK